jgi:purine-binding chemotaxis protein CheW
LAGALGCKRNEDDTGRTGMANADKMGTVRTNQAAGKFLTFYLAGEEYGIEILKVHEIIGMMTVTGVPQTPHFVRGVINLRGKVIPVVDLRLKFGMEGKELTSETCIIVVTIHGVQTGIIVDKVSEVLNIPASDIEEVPSFGDGVRTDYILGIGKLQNRVRILLSIDRVLSQDEFSGLSSLAAENQTAAA